jgi:hypothetical protein
VTTSAKDAKVLFFFRKSTIPACQAPTLQKHPHHRWIIQSDKVAARQEIANECRLADLPWANEIDDAGCLKGLFEAGL